MKRCVIYSRVSADHQDYKRQINDLKQYAIDEKYTIDYENEIFAETISATKQGKDLKEREKFSAMREYISEHNIKTILMWEVSRLARNAANALGALEELKAEQVNVHFYNGGLDSLDPQKWLTITILTAVAEQEAKYLKERVISGKKNSSMRGTVAGFYGKSIPYGYKSVKETAKTAGVLTIDEEESDVIHLIFDWAEGKGEPGPVSMRNIAMRLNEPPYKVPTRWKKLGRDTDKKGLPVDRIWRTNNIALILRNEIYKGVRSIKVGEKPPEKRGDKPEIIRKDVEFPEIKIIEPEQWANVQTLIRKRVGSKHNALKYKYLLKGKIVCGSCGRLYGCASERRYGEQTYYRCYGSNDIHPTKKCRQGQFNGGAMDEGVYSLLFQHKDLFAKMKDDTLSEVDIEAKREQIELNEHKISEDQRALQKAVKMNLRGDYGRAYGSEREGSLQYNRDRKLSEKNIREYEALIKKLSQEIEDHQAMANLDVDTWMGEIDLYETDDFDRKLEFVKKYVDKVVFHKVKDSNVGLKDLLWNKVDHKGYFNRIDNILYIEGGEAIFYSPDGNDSIAYVEIYAFGSPKPLRGLISSRSKLCHYSSDTLIISEGTLKWDKKPNVKELKQERLTLVEAKKRLEKFRDGEIPDIDLK